MIALTLPSPGPSREREGRRLPSKIGSLVVVPVLVSRGTLGPDATQVVSAVAAVLFALAVDRQMDTERQLTELVAHRKGAMKTLYGLEVEAESWGWRDELRHALAETIEVGQRRRLVDDAA